MKFILLLLSAMLPCRALAADAPATRPNIVSRRGFNIRSSISQYPAEATDLAAKQPAELKRMHDLLEKIIAGAGHPLTR